MLSKAGALALLWLLAAGSFASRLAASEAPATAESRPPFVYPSRSYSPSDSLFHLTVVYGVSWAVYPLFQPDVMEGEKGSWREYKQNFGRTVFDQDEPVWNWIVHPSSGSQLFLFYRALGYDRPDSFAMTFISSALFEYTIEVYSEPASYQDLYQTPVLGSAVGYGLELLSTGLLNSSSTAAHVLGRVINPMSFIVDGGSASLMPISDRHGSYGLQLTMDW